LIGERGRAGKSIKKAEKRIFAFVLDSKIRSARIETVATACLVSECKHGARPSRQ
jgi:hypothetical protein